MLSSYHACETIERCILRSTAVLFDLFKFREFSQYGVNLENLNGFMDLFMDSGAVIVLNCFFMIMSFMSSHLSIILLHFFGRAFM